MSLHGEEHASALQELTLLLMPLFDPELSQSVKAKDVIALWLTGAFTSDTNARRSYQWRATD